MQHFRKILVGVDLSKGDRLATANLSAPNEAAVERALWLAGRNKAELTFFTAIDVSPHTQHLLEQDSGVGSQNLQTATEGVLADLIDRAQQEGVTAQAELKFGRPWECIIRKVMRDGDELVVVGTREQGAAVRFLFGSTANKLLRYCPCPVWVTKPDVQPEEFHILVPSDFSEVSQRALEIAVNGGQLNDAYVHVLHAVEFTMDHRPWLSDMNEEKLADIRRKARAEAEKKLQEQLAKTDQRTLKYGAQIQVEEGPADRVILDAINQHKIDLVVMGTISRGGIAGALIGNTSERLLPEMPCSILAVKPADFVSPLSAE